MDADEDFLLVDVREPNEYEIVSIPGSVLIPKGDILSGEALASLPKDKPIVLHCKSGARSAEALAALNGRIRRRRACRRRRARLGQAGRSEPAVLLIAPRRRRRGAEPATPAAGPEGPRRTGTFSSASAEPGGGQPVRTASSSACSAAVVATAVSNGSESGWQDRPGRRHRAGQDVVVGLLVDAGAAEDRRVAVAVEGEQPGPARRRRRPLVVRARALSGLYRADEQQRVGRPSVQGPA